MLRYPPTSTTCKNCKTSMAMYNDPYCGRCAEMLGRPDRQDVCKRCGAPDGVWIARSLACPATWIKISGGVDDEPGYGKSRRSTVLASGLCRWCSDSGRGRFSAPACEPEDAGPEEEADDCTTLQDAYDEIGDRLYRERREEEG